jgi:hypothetical protein
MIIIILIIIYIMVFSNSPTSCIDCHLKKRGRYFETNDRRVDGKDGKDDFDDESTSDDERKISPWTVCQFEFDEDYLSNGNENRKYMRN